MLDAELEDTGLQTRLQAVGEGVTAAHMFTVADWPHSSLLTGEQPSNPQQSLPF